MVPFSGNPVVPLLLALPAVVSPYAQVVPGVGRWVVRAVDGETGFTVCQLHQGKQVVESIMEFISIFLNIINYLDYALDSLYHHESICKGLML